MSDPLLPYYESELVFIRRLAQDFAKRYPAAASRLHLEPGRSTDPHVERLIEATALLSARVRAKLHDEFPELTDGLLGVLYPHYLAPVPSCSVVQFDADPARGNPDGTRVPAGGTLLTQRLGEVACRFRTTYPVTLWPVVVAEAKLAPPPFPPGLSPPDRAVAAFRLRLNAPGQLGFDQLNLSRLRFFLHGDGLVTYPLYELLMNHAERVVVRPADRKGPALSLSPAEAIRPVGFAADEGILPYPRQSFAGYRLLTEFFAFPQKFLFIDLAGLEPVRGFGPCRALEVVVFLNRTSQRAEQGVTAETLRLGATPALNLFEHTLEPVPLTHLRTEYRLTPDVANPDAFEVYSLQQVTAAGPDGTDTEYRPFYDYRDGGDRDSVGTFWHTTRRASPVDGDPGTDVYLHLTDRDFDPAAPAGDVLVVRALCTNRDLPVRLPRVGEDVHFSPAFAAPGTRLRCLVPPTPPQRPPTREGRFWGLVSHLNLNHLSLGDSVEGAAALRGLLRLYDFNDPDADPQTAGVARRVIDAVTEVLSAPTAAWVDGGFARGVEVRVTVEEPNFSGSSPYLFGAVLERFLGLYVSVNSFTQLVLSMHRREGEWKRWPPRAGDRRLV